MTDKVTDTIHQQRIDHAVQKMTDDVRKRIRLADETNEQRQTTTTTSLSSSSSTLSSHNTRKSYHCNSIMNHPIVHPTTLTNANINLGVFSQSKY